MGLRQLRLRQSTSQSPYMSALYVCLICLSLCLFYMAALYVCLICVGRVQVPISSLAQVYMSALYGCLRCRHNRIARVRGLSGPCVCVWARMLALCVRVRACARRHTRLRPPPRRRARMRCRTAESMEGWPRASQRPLQICNSSGRWLFVLARRGDVVRRRAWTTAFAP